MDNAIDAASSWVRARMASGPDGWLRVTVRDNGPGITAEPIEQVFKPQWTTKGDGHGFGLSVVQDRVRRLHGRITVHNDGGAVFEVFLPTREVKDE